MKSNRAALLGGAALGLVALVAAGGYALNAATSGPSVAIDADDIGGVVLNPSGQPEAGVWVIAETKDLEVRYIKIVVTDDQGRFVVPDLPQANYQVWVRGYGLVDSDKTTSAPGASAEPHREDRAERACRRAVLSGGLLVFDDEDSRARKSSAPARRFPANVTQEVYLDTIKSNGCVGCHQIGQLSTRTIPESSCKSRAACMPTRGSVAFSPARPACR